MNKKDRKYYIFILLILITISVVEYKKPKPADWRFTLEQKDKIPYGTYVLFNTIKDLFPKNNIVTKKNTFWEYSKFLKNKKQKNFLVIAENFNIDKLETQSLLNLADKGNTIFISAHKFSGKFNDTLNFSTTYSALFDSTNSLNFYNRKLHRKNSYFYKKSASFMIFNRLDTANAEILAYDKKKNVVFFRQNYGKGTFYINSTPEVFTNYAVIAEGNYEFAYKTLSYLPEKDLVWDEYYKPFRKLYKTSLSFLLSEKSLKAAWLLLLLTTLLFVFFTAKRNQRIIPIIKPYENKSVEFVKTISGLYFKSKNHRDIALKRFNYLNNFLKSKYNVNLSDKEIVNLDKTFFKTGIDKDLLKKLLSYHTKINNLETVSEQILTAFNKIIEEIYESCNNNNI